MEPSTPYRPRVSRETRLLLTAGVVAVAALWLLARVRFQDRPPTPNPIPAVLSQLTSGPKYEDLAAEIAQLQPRLERLLLAMETPGVPTGARQPPHRIVALRVRDDVAVSLLPTSSLVDEASLLARDRASGLAVVRVLNQAPSSPPVAWATRRLQQPRYFIASDVSATGVSLRPVFVGSLDPMASPLWSEAVWIVPERTDLAPGSFLFTSDAELVGMVIGAGGERAIMPGAILLAEAERLLTRPRAPAGTIGVEVQALTKPLAAMTDASAGVVVTWVERGGAAAGHLMVGDVIEAVDGRPLVSRQLWDVRVARLSVGETLTLRVRRGGEVREVAVMPISSEAPPVVRSLGLTLRDRTGFGADVIRVDRGAAGDRAGLLAGDLITLIAALPAPTPTQVSRAFSSVSQGQGVMMAVTRGTTHFVTTLER